MFQTARCVQFDDQAKKVHISFLKKFMIFEDVLNSQKSVWLFVLEEIFGSGMQPVCLFDGAAQVTAVQADVVVKKIVPSLEQPVVAPRVQLPPKAQAPAPYVRSSHYVPKKEQAVPVPQQGVKKIEKEDLHRLPLAQEVLKHFDGILLEIDGDEL